MISEISGMKTIKQMADELGIDKQRVYRYIRKNHINEAHQRCGVMYYDEAVEMAVIQHFCENDAHHDVHHEAHHTASNDTVTTSLDAVIDVLKTELEIKNEQIRELNARLAESNAALVAAQQSAQAAQALHAGTMQKQLIDVSTSSNGTRAGFLTRIFRRRSNN